MGMQLIKRIRKNKKNIIFTGTHLLAFALVLLFVGILGEKVAAADIDENSTVKKVELDLQPGFGASIPVWQALPGDDEWIFNYHYLYTKDLAHMSNVMEYATMTLRVYPSDEYSGIKWKDWTVKTEWTVSGDTDIIRLANEDTSSGWEGVPGTVCPEGTGSKVNYDIITADGEVKQVGPYYEETAVIIPTGKIGTCAVSAKVIDENGEVHFLPGKKITVKRWLDVNPDIKITEVASGRIVHTYRESEEGYGLNNLDQQTILPQTYTGKPITPKLVVKDKEKSLVEGKDYELSYLNNVDVGTWSNGKRGAAIWVTGCGDYSGVIEIPFDIEQDYSSQNNQTQPEPEKKLSCTGTYKKALDSKPFKLSVKNATGKVSYTSSNKKVATVNSKGVVTLKGTGLAKITVKASNGSVVSKVYVAPKKTSISKVKSTAKKTVTVTWKKDTKATGYEIQCNTNKNFKSGNKTVTVKKAKTTSAKVTKLKSGKKYYVRMRSYKTISGKKYAGSWSKVLTVKVK